MFYFVRMPGWLERIYGNKNCAWRMPGNGKTIYLTFDDGPHPSITDFVLDELDQYNAKATFFCIGKNVVAYPAIYQRILDKGHSVGNHTYDHLNGWKTPDRIYIENIDRAGKEINSNLFRPPYGRIKRSQLRMLTAGDRKFTTIMWTVLSGDFDPGLSSEKCLRNIMLHTKGGSIVVLHDSEKAFERLKFVLPRLLDHFSGQGYHFEKIVQ